MIRLIAFGRAAIREHGREAYPGGVLRRAARDAGDGTARPASRGPSRIENAQPRRAAASFPRSSRTSTARVEALADAERLSGSPRLLPLPPDHPAVPSEYDREHALPFFHYVVLAVVAGESPARRRPSCSPKTAGPSSGKRSACRGLRRPEVRTMPKIHLPTPLRPYAGRRRDRRRGGRDGRRGARLARRAARRRSSRHLYDESGRLRSFVNVYRERRGRPVPRTGGDRGLAAGLALDHPVDRRRLGRAAGRGRCPPRSRTRRSAATRAT